MCIQDAPKTTPNLAPPRAAVFTRSEKNLRDCINPWRGEGEVRDKLRLALLSKLIIVYYQCSIQRSFLYIVHDFGEEIRDGLRRYLRQKSKLTKSCVRNYIRSWVIANTYVNGQWCFCSPRSISVIFRLSQSVVWNFSNPRPLGGGGRICPFLVFPK